MNVRAKLIMEEDFTINPNSFDYDIEALTAQLINMPNETKVYKSVFIADGVLNAYPKGKKNPPTAYHFIPYRVELNRLRAEGILPPELFIGDDHDFSRPDEDKQTETTEGDTGSEDEPNEFDS